MVTFISINSGGGGPETDPVFLAQKGAANGAATLDSSTLVPTDQLGTGVADGTKVLFGDRTWGVSGGTQLARAATFVVKGDGTGDYTTIEAAVAAAPATGADIYVREGTYAPATTITLPLDRSIKIRGAGAVGITVITMPTGVPLFSVAGGSTAEYSFAGFKAQGDGSASQSLISTASSVNFYFDDVETDTCTRIVNTTAQPTVVFTNCEFNNMPSSIFQFWSGTSGGKLVWNYVSASHGSGNFSPGAVVGDPEWIVATGYIGGPAYSTYALGHVVWHNLRLDTANVTISVANSRIDSCEFQNVGITVTADDFICDGSVFSGGDSTSAFQIKLSGDHGAMTGNLFQGGVARAIDILSTSTDNVVSGNWFFAYVSEGLQTASSALVASGNTGLEVVETGAADNNRFFDITSASTIIGPSTTVNGVLRKDVVGGTTTDVFVDQFTHLNTKGMTGSGSIKNTGGSNTMTVRVTAIDAFAVTDTATFDILPGASATYTMMDAVGTALSPFVSYVVAVKSTSAGNATTFTLHHATTGAY